MLQPKTVIEIGTAEGLSALALLEFLPANGYIHTFDIIPWDRFTPQALRTEDFADGKLVQHVEDLSNPIVFEKHKTTLEAADLIFIDGPKDGITEPAIITALSALKASRRPLVILDDVRFLNMIELWQQLKKPRIDLTTFGHWTGTGVVQW